LVKEVAMVRTDAPVVGGRPRWIVLGLLVAVVLAAPPRLHAQAGQAPAARVFASDAGMVLNFIKSDKVADFEAVMSKLKEALAKSDKPERKQQAASWKIFKSPDPAQGGAVLYVFVIDPAVKGADYTVSTILNEAFPQEVQTLYKQYAEAYASGQNFVNLALVSDLGK
jgi:hypothetical protein